MRGAANGGFEPIVTDAAERSGGNKGRFADLRCECEPEQFLIQKADLQLAPLSYDPVLQRVGPVRPIATCRSHRSISALFFSGKWHIVFLNAQETAGIVLGLSALE